MKGGLWNQYTDPIEGENLMKFIHKTKTKDKIRHGQNTIQNDTKCIISHYRMSNMPPYKVCIYAHRFIEQH